MAIAKKSSPVLAAAITTLLGLLLLGIIFLVAGRYYFQIVSVSFDSHEVRLEFSEEASREMHKELGLFEHDSGDSRLASPYSYSSHILFSLSELGIVAGVIFAIAACVFLSLTACFTWAAAREKRRD